MSTPDPKEVIRLIEEMTRAEIMARLGPSSDIDWFMTFIKKKDELQEYLFGSSDYVKLGIQWGILKANKPKGKKKTVTSEIDDMIGDL